MGIQLEEQQLGSVYSLVMSLAERKRVLYAEDLKLAVDEALGRATPGRYALKDVQVHSQSGLSSSAEVSLIDEGAVKTGSSSGTGTLDAVFRAIQRNPSVMFGPPKLAAIICPAAMSSDIASGTVGRVATVAGGDARDVALR
ncbi:MAG: hypothetical protein E6I25_05785 [Chloroflexi bacterium]|nr:MAG: hypothetical protein E6I25_05785 [Chloroflexota bacterium]